MKIGLTGATGFLGRYVLRELNREGHACRCWKRPDSDLTGLDRMEGVEWVSGDLAEPDRFRPFVKGLDAVVHGALARPGRPGGLRGLFKSGAEIDYMEFVKVNLLGSLSLMESARKAGVGRFVFISSCAVHEIILPDRLLDEAHPLWPTDHYGAQKAALEKFIHGYGFGRDRWKICALRPTGIYGVDHPPEGSKWFDLIRRVKRGDRISDPAGGKEVHAGDVARAVSLLLRAEGIEGQAYNCYDLYVANQDVAEIAKGIFGSRSEIERLNRGPKHQIDTGKIRSLGMAFGGRELLEKTVRELAEYA
jgi:nucleoside-diphosphate-sugar epimerase